jgi:CRP/FNR family transcriptional regulator, cyclic AMP receptor protein
MPVSKNDSGGKTSKAIIDVLISIPIFDSLKSDELKLVTRYVNLTDVGTGEVVFKEGDQGNYVCFVVEGTLEVLKGADTGHQVLIATLGKNRSIGEMAVIDDFPRSATVRAMKPGTLLILTREGFDSIIEEHPRTGVKILKGLARLLSQNLRKTSSRLADYMLPLS